MTTPQRMAPVGSPQPTSSIWGNIGGLLGSAVDAYAKVEEIKALKNSTGQGRVEQSLVPEYDNGAAVLVEPPKQTPAQTKAAEKEQLIFGMMTQKQALMAASGLAVLLLLLRTNK